MSYCRWSSEDFRSDLYVYANVSGAWTIHVAGQRHRETPPPDYVYPEEHKVWNEARTAFSMTPEGAEAWRNWLDQYNPMDPIELPHAGETFDTASPGECADKCEELAALGYHVPEWVVPDLREEQAEMDGGSDVVEPSEEPPAAD